MDDNKIPSPPPLISSVISEISALPSTEPSQTKDTDKSHPVNNLDVNISVEIESENKPEKEFKGRRRSITRAPNVEKSFAITKVHQDEIKKRMKEDSDINIEVTEIKLEEKSDVPKPPPMLKIPSHNLLSFPSSASDDGSESPYPSVEEIFEITAFNAFIGYSVKVHLYDFYAFCVDIFGVELDDYGFELELINQNIDVLSDSENVMLSKKDCETAITSLRRIYDHNSEAQAIIKRHTDPVFWKALIKWIVFPFWLIYSLSDKYSNCCKPNEDPVNSNPVISRVKPRATALFDNVVVQRKQVRIQTAHGGKSDNKSVLSIPRKRKHLGNRQSQESKYLSLIGPDVTNSTIDSLISDMEKSQWAEVSCLVTLDHLSQMGPAEFENNTEYRIFRLIFERSPGIRNALLLCMSQRLENADFKTYVTEWVRNDTESLFTLSNILMSLCPSRKPPLSQVELRAAISFANIFDSINHGAVCDTFVSAVHHTDNNIHMLTWYFVIADKILDISSAAQSERKEDQKSDQKTPIRSSFRSRLFLSFIKRIDGIWRLSKRSGESARHRRIGAKSDASQILDLSRACSLIFLLRNLNVEVALRLCKFPSFAEVIQYLFTQVESTQSSSSAKDFINSLFDYLTTAITTYRDPVKNVSISFGKLIPREIWVFLLNEDGWKIRVASKVLASRLVEILSTSVQRDFSSYITSRCDIPTLLAPLGFEKAFQGSDLSMAVTLLEASRKSIEEEANCQADFGQSLSILNKLGIQTPMLAAVSHTTSSAKYSKINGPQIWTLFPYLMAFLLLFLSLFYDLAQITDVEKTHFFQHHLVSENAIRDKFIKKLKYILNHTKCGFSTQPQEKTASENITTAWRVFQKVYRQRNPATNLRTNFLFRSATSLSIAVGLGHSLILVFSRLSYTTFSDLPEDWTQSEILAMLIYTFISFILNSILISAICMPLFYGLVHWDIYTRIMVKMHSIARNTFDYHTFLINEEKDKVIKRIRLDLDNPHNVAAWVRVRSIITEYLHSGSSAISVSDFYQHFFVVVLLFLASFVYTNYRIFYFGFKEWVEIDMIAFIDMILFLVYIVLYIVVGARLNSGMDSHVSILQHRQYELRRALLAQNEVFIKQLGVGNKIARQQSSEHFEILQGAYELIESAIHLIKEADKPLTFLGIHLTIHLAYNFVTTVLTIFFFIQLKLSYVK